MTAITVRNLPAAVAKAVRERARKERISLDKAVVRLLEEATGVARRKERIIHHDLDHFSGTWCQAEYEAFMVEVREQRQVDPEMWK